MAAKNRLLGASAVAETGPIAACLGLQLRFSSNWPKKKGGSNTDEVFRSTVDCTERAGEYCLRFMCVVTWDVETLTFHEASGLAEG